LIRPTEEIKENLEFAERLLNYMVETDQIIDGKVLGYFHDDDKIHVAIKPKASVAFIDMNIILSKEDDETINYT